MHVSLSAIVANEWLAKLPTHFSCVSTYEPRVYNTLKIHLGIYWGWVMEDCRTFTSTCLLLSLMTLVYSGKRKVVLRIGADFYPSRILDLRSRIQPYLWPQNSQIFCANWHKIIVFFTQDIVTRLSQIRIGAPGSGKTNPGSRGQKSNGSRLHITGTCVNTSVT